MLHQENSEVYVRHHSEQLACGNLRGSDDGRSNFLPEKYHIATEWNTTACLVNAANAVKEVTADHYKRPASSGFPGMVDCKRMKQEEQNVAEKDNAPDADINIPEYGSYRTWERISDPPAYGSEESEDEGVDPPVNYSLAQTYVEDYLRSASYYQREDLYSSVSLCPMRKTVPIGPNYQAELPECASDNCRSSVDDCSCVDEGSIACVRKHVKEARERLMSTLGPNTFKELGFFDMGEEVALRWAEDEEHLFQDVVSLNPASLGRNFWDELLIAFPLKTNKELVSYYFNVFMLRKRAEQNRFDPTNVDSDNDEWEGSDDDEFAVTERAGDDLPLESLTDQDDGACNRVPLQGNVDEESAEDEFDCSSGDRQENCCMEGNVMLSLVDNNQEAIIFDTDAQDDSCTSFEAPHVCATDGTPTDIAGDHYRVDGFGSVADHGYFGGHCDPKMWDIGFSSVWEKGEFFSTNNVIEEVFGKGSCENGNDSSTAQGIM